jgi:hypothetical protein
MSKYLKLYVNYFLLALAALIITWFTQFAALYGHPTISQPSIYCSTDAYYVPTSPPSHDSGLPIPYITHYISDNGCGVGRPIALYLFIIDCLIWFLVMIGVIRLIKYLSKK